MYEVRRRRRKKKKTIMTRSMKQGLLVFSLIIFIVMAVLVWRIYWLNQNRGDTYKRQMLSQQSYVNNTLKYRRGEIKDRNGTAMAVSSRVFNVILEPRTILSDEKYQVAVVGALAEHLGAKQAEIEKIIADKPSSLYEEVDSLKALTSDQVEGFQKAMKENASIKGVWLQEDYVRKYPLKTVACDILGFASKDNVGSYGIEEQFNEMLNGSEGREYGYFDSQLNLQRTVKPAANGNNIILTVDSNVQKIVEDEIAAFQKKTGSSNMAVMIMNPNTGEILAMASDPVYDLNNPRDLAAVYTEQEVAKMNEKAKLNALMQLWGNFCISSAYEPGSTFKPFTVAAALDEGLVSESSGFVCGGKKKVADRDINCANRSGHGAITLEQSLMESCNVALMDIGLKLGRDTFSKYNDLFGFGKKTGIELPGEASGLIHTTEQLNPVELATSSFGQTQTVTMVQMLTGFCSLINGGNYYEPRIVKEIQNEEGAVVKEYAPVLVKKTTTAKTSSLLRKFLKSTVENGTAAPAKVKGYSIGGKTGTAEKRPVSEKNYLVSFIGCVPAENPEIAFYVIIDEPHVEDQAHSTYATEFSSGLMKKVLPFLGVYAK